MSLRVISQFANSDDQTKSFNQSATTRSEIRLSRALMLINAELGQERNLLNRISSIQNVREVYATYGVYDLIAIIEAETQDRLREVITGKIRSLPGLKTTLTMIIVE